MLRSDARITALRQIDSPRNPLLEAKRIMATSYPIVEGVQFKDMPGFPDYSVGDDGSVWSKARISKNRATTSTNHNNGWKVLSGQISCQGYRYVGLYRNGKQFRKKVGRLVLEAFRCSCPDGMVLCHFPDRRRTNDRLSNLRWDTVSGNAQDAKIHGTRRHGSKINGSKLKEVDVYEIRAMLARGMPGTTLARMFGVGEASISAIRTRRCWSHLP